MNLILDEQIQIVSYTSTTRKMNGQINNPILPRMNNTIVAIFFLVTIAFRRKRFPSWYLFRVSLVVINSCVINESCTGKVQLPMQRWFPTPPFRPLFLFSLRVLPANLVEMILLSTLLLRYFSLSRKKILKSD